MPSPCGCGPLMADIPPGLDPDDVLLVMGFLRRIDS
jgi:hypothetical protein